MQTWQELARKANFDADPAADSRLAFHVEVVEIEAQKEIPVIDVLIAFREHRDPVSLLPFRHQGHYTPKGYALTAATIIDVLQKPAAHKE